MSRKTLKILLFIIFAILISVTIYSYDIDYKIREWQKKMFQASRQEASFEKGETLIFNVQFKGIKIGKAELVFDPQDPVDNLNFISLNANLTNLYDREEIYGDKINLYPLKVKRTLNIFGQHMDITEEYDQKHNCVKIIKNKSSKNNGQTIKSDTSLDNIILVIYKLRKIRRLNVGDRFDFNLPTRKIKMEVKSIQRLNVPLGTYNAYYIESTPGKFRIWLDTNNNRLPLRVEGVVFLGLATMTLSEVK